MTFIWPVMLVLLLVLPLLVFAYLRLQARRRRLLESYGSSGLFNNSSSNKLGARRHIPSAIFLVALLILIVALARPQTVVSLPNLEGTVILAFDVSGSMAADDLKPTRMEAAKVAARAFVERQPSSVQVGVVSFSEGGFAIQAPTNEQADVLAAINRLSVQRGTALSSGIEASLAAIDAVEHPQLTLAEPSLTPAPTPEPVPAGSYKSAVIIMLTDGENTQNPDPMETAQKAADLGIRIYTVGVGSAEGATLEIDGFTIRSRLDEATLQNISALTGGAYYNAIDEEQLRQIYDNLNPQLVLKPQETEVTSLFAGAGILVLMIGSTLSLLWLGRLP